MKHSRSLGTDLPDKDDARRMAASPATAEMIGHLDEQGVETLLDRFAAQQPQCGFGLQGLCCHMCQWGPCRITAKSPRGVCGRDADLVVAANLLRAVAAGASAQTMHARELVLTLSAAAHGEGGLSLKGEDRLRGLAHALNVAWSWDPKEAWAEKVAQVTLEDLGRMTGDRMRTLMRLAPKERIAVWGAAGVLPRSAAYEVVESMHQTTLGSCSDWRELMLQALRTGLAYAYSGLVTASMVTDILFGVPEPVSAEVDFGILKPDHVNVLVHGHSPIMLEKVLEKLRSEEIQALAREKGAAGIVVGGMCCSGHEALSRHGIPTVSGAMGQELVVGTGAVDAVVVDMQCVLPGLALVAECFGTEIVTTCRSNRIPGATHVPFDPEQPASLDDDAMRVARIAVEAYARRDRSRIHIPAGTTTVMTGFTQKTVLDAFGGVRKLVPLLRDGSIRGVVAMVGCSTPKAGFETSHVTIARELIRRGYLVLASGCSAHALLNAGLCSTSAASEAAPGLREACEAAGVPPVLAVGSCSDNTRILLVMAGLAWEARLPLPEMPFAVCGPEFASEKTMGQLMAVLAHGVTTVVGLTPNLPVTSSASADAPEGGIVDFLCSEGLHVLVGSRLVIEPDPEAAVERIAGLIEEKRAAWSAEGREAV